MSTARRALHRALIPIICVMTFGMPVVVWCISTGNIGGYFLSAVPPGQTLFVASKLFALIAIVMFWFQAMSALAQRTPMLAGFPQLSGLAHAYFGAATYAAVLTHCVLFVAASSMRTKHAGIDLFLPVFGAGFYRAMISLGTIAFWLLLAAIFAGWRRRRGDARYKWAHRGVFAVFTLAFVHGLTIGSETRFGLMTYVYAFIALSLGMGMLSRIWIAARRVRQRSAPLVGAVLPVVDKPNAHPY